MLNSFLASMWNVRPLFWNVKTLFLKCETAFLKCDTFFSISWPTFNLPFLIQNFEKVWNVRPFFLNVSGFLKCYTNFLKTAFLKVRLVFNVKNSLTFQKKRPHISKPGLTFQNDLRSTFSIFFCMSVEKETPKNNLTVPLRSHICIKSFFKELWINRTIFYGLYGLYKLAIFNFVLIFLNHLPWVFLKGLAKQQTTLKIHI